MPGTLIIPNCLFSGLAVNHQTPAANMPPLHAYEMSMHAVLRHGSQIGHTTAGSQGSVCSGRISMWTLPRSTMLIADDGAHKAAE